MIEVKVSINQRENKRLPKIGISAVANCEMSHVNEVRIRDAILKAVNVEYKKMAGEAGVEFVKNSMRGDHTKEMVKMVNQKYEKFNS